MKLCKEIEDVDQEIREENIIRDLLNPAGQHRTSYNPITSPISCGDSSSSVSPHGSNNSSSSSSSSSSDGGDDGSGDDSGNVTSSSTRSVGSNVLPRQKHNPNNQVGLVAVLRQTSQGFNWEVVQREVRDAGTQTKRSRRWRWSVSTSLSTIEENYFSE